MVSLENSLSVPDWPSWAEQGAGNTRFGEHLQAAPLACVPAAPISPGNPSNGALLGLGWAFEQSRLWDAAGTCPVQREPFFVLLIFRGRFPSFTACLFYNGFDAGEDKLSHKGKTTNHLAALNRLFFFSPL